MYAHKPIMPFGREAGRPIVQLETEYLLWLLATVRLPDGLRRSVAGELARRRVPFAVNGR